MKQTTLLDVWASPKRPTFQTHLAETAKETLEPHFVRPIPEDSRYTKRLEEEYSLIDKNSFGRVFLQVKKILELIRELGEIPHIIRGSAGSSLVCYLLGITHIDPLLYGIELARFMNTARTDIPDIDIDVPYNRREEIYKRIAETWPEQVARVSNHVLWKQKSALRDTVTQALKEKTPTTEIQSALKAVRKKQFQIPACLKAETLTLQTTASEKQGTLRTYSKHCGGIVIFEDQGHVPESLILKPLDHGLVQLQLNKDQVEDAGFIKIDVLSNRGLAQIAEICPSRPFTAYPTRCASTERIFAKGKTLGITFGESRGMRKIFMEMQPRNVKEIAVGLALIRPAAAAEGRKQAFLDKWKLIPGKESDVLLRPIIFDDDAILKVRRALGCTSAEADRWRKSFAKQNAAARVQFRQALLAKGYSKSIQDTLIEDLEQLMYYSFCKSHALSYAQLVWALGYWKAHHPHAFWCATLNHCHSEYRKWVHYREARCSGVLLSRQPPPYTLGTRGGVPALLGSSPEQTLLIDETSQSQTWQDMKERGYWLTEAFLPGCFMRKESQRRLDGKQSVSFRGLIATGRTVQRNGSVCTLLCIGIDNEVYVDLVLANKARNDLFRWMVVEGKGFLREDSLTVDVETIRGVSLKQLYCG
jgi:DNA polymerase III alpha subunit